MNKTTLKGREIKTSRCDWLKGSPKKKKLLNQRTNSAIPGALVHGGERDLLGGGAGEGQVWGVELCA